MCLCVCVQVLISTTVYHRQYQQLLSWLLHNSYESQRIRRSAGRKRKHTEQNKLSQRSEFKSLLLSFLSTRGRRRSHFTPSLRSSNTESDKNTQLASEKTRTFSCLINNLKERRYDEQTLCCGVGAAVSLGWLGGASRLLHHPSCLLHLTSPETLQLRPPGGEFSDGDATAHNLLDQLHHERNTSSN